MSELYRLYVIMRTTCPVNVVLLDFIILIILSEEKMSSRKFLVHSIVNFIIYDI
jgi:hypothetical protein